MAQLDGCEVGDVVWLAWVHIEQRFKGEPAVAQAFVNKAFVVNAELDVVNTDSGRFPPRTLYQMERVFRTEHEGRLHCAQVVEAAALALWGKARELQAEAEAAVAAQEQGV